MGSIDRGGPPKLKTVVVPRQKYPEACVWQPTSNLLVLFKFFVGYSFLVSRPRCGEVLCDNPRGHLGNALYAHCIRIENAADHDEMIKRTKDALNYHTLSNLRARCGVSVASVSPSPRSQRSWLLARAIPRG